MSSTENADTSDCGFATEEIIRVIDGRWKLNILSNLFMRPDMRFSDLCRAVVGISEKMLAQQLKELERDNLIERTVYPVVPPRVEYRLSQDGRDLAPAIKALVDWAAARRNRK